MPVAASFDWEFEDGSSLSTQARLDTMVTVVDTTTFIDEIGRGQRLADRDLQAGAGDERCVSDLLVDQVEFADVLVLSKTDLASDISVGTTESMVRKLNPTARIIRAVGGDVALDQLLGTGLFDLHAAQQLPGWDDELAGGHTPETDEYRISSTVFRSSRPFHPQRLAVALSQLRNVVRSKGFCWIASRPNLVAVWSQAGPNLTIEPAARWDATDIDAGQEIVLIGIDLDKTLTRATLRTALLTDAEFALGERGWLSLPDPFDSWDAPHAHP